MGTEAVTEVERKYDVGDDVIVPALHELPGVASVAQPVEHRLDATYYDTSDLALARARITLRRRTGGDDEGWHLKLPVQGDARQELRVPLGDRPPDAVPEVLVTRVRAYVLGRPLVPVATISNRRVVHRLLDHGGVELAELCDDHVTGTRLVGGGHRGELVWREWEVELVTAGPELLDAAEEGLLAAGARPASGPSKLARVLDVVAPAAAAPGPDMTAGELLVEYVAAQLDRIRDHDGPVRDDAEDAVHQMRVGARRLRSVLATYRPVLDADAAEPLRAELTWLGGMLAAARDTEVMRARLLDLVAQEPAELVLGPVARRIGTAMDQRYATARKAVLEALDSDRYLALLGALEAFASQPPSTSAASRRAGEVLPELLERDWKRLRRRAADAAAADAEGHDHALHEMRKAAKRMRYASEMAAPALGDPWSTVAERCEAVQDLLGEHQDTVVLRAALRELGVQAHLSGENGFTFGRLHALEQARAGELSRELTEAVGELPKKAAGWG